MNILSLVPEISNFPSSWKTVPFDEAFEDATGGNAKIKQSDYLSTGCLPVIDQGQSFIAGYVDDNSLSCRVNLPVILFGDHTKTLKFVTDPFALGADGVKVLVPCPELDARFGYYYLQLVRFPSNTGYSRHFKYLKAIKVPLPPPDEQRRIAAILDKADAIRRKRQESIRLTEEFLRSTFLEMFGDPVTNPKGWETKKLENLIAIQGGYAFKSSDYTAEGIPLVRIGTANKKYFDSNNIVYLPVSYAHTYARFLLEPGDMVITLTGTAGKDDYGNVNIVPDTYSKWLLNQRVAKIKIVNNLITNRYLFMFLSDTNIKDGMISNNRGIRQGNLNNSDILSQVITLPPMDMQVKLDKIVASVKSLDSKNLDQFELSKKFFESLTHRAFRGEL